MQQIQNIRGMNDILPEDIYIWQYVEKVFKDTVEKYGYKEIRFPIVESTDLFKRSIGEATDVVEKEMYTFEDKGGDSLTLRPEGTASCVRAGIQHGLFYNQQQRLWYSGPMFRYDRPQKGRYRQFHQFGAEAFGIKGPDIDAEIILMLQRFWKALGLTKNHVKLQLNSLGLPEERVKYRKTLVDYFSKHFDSLDEDSKRRLNTNPLRILDSKNPYMQSLIEDAPKLIDVLGEESKEHFNTLCDILKDVGIEYKINKRLVRGLDYYSKTVFEWVTEELGAQGSICGGGRFDFLVELMGGQPTFGIGFSIGAERLISLISTLNLLPDILVKPDIFLINLGSKTQKTGLILAEKIREQIPNINLFMNCEEVSLKNQLKKADKSGAKIALILGEEELKKEEIVVKNLREDVPQENISLENITNYLIKQF